MNRETCYFYMEEKEDGIFMMVMCDKCHNEKYPQLGWRHEDGFGHNHDVICDICNKVIYKGELNGTETKD